MTISTCEQFRDVSVLITGATGFTGRVLTKKLAAAGAQIRAIARPTSQLGDLADLNVTWLKGEVFDPETVRRAADGVEYIFHIAAAYRQENATEEDYRRVHVYSTQLLAEVVKDQTKFKRFIHVSTVGVHGHIPGDDLADETYRFSPGDSYQRTKLEAEQWLTDFATRSGIPHTVIRPGAILGPGDERLLKIFKMVQNGFILMLGSGKGMYHLIHVEDLTDILLAAAVSDKARSQVFIAANDEPISIIGMGKVIAKTLQKKIRVIRLPIWPFFLAADLCKVICTPLGIQPPLYRRRVAFYTKDRKFNNTKLKQLLGYSFRYSNESGLAETARWYKQQGWLAGSAAKKQPLREIFYCKYITDGLVSSLSRYVEPAIGPASDFVGLSLL
ncbi:MAG: Nucleoside-diphosphate-sugar epimerase [Candidatus Electronema aureum]|uniref:Nucleoside-diphosphate-sugar epimerase n=1 Tax=Candidatus Electronema aureum TaxID=2005002 RepID=A0A521G3W4_9BACT|nr:MAG: Nucleoside-diphosphate-sugar epimerase [Candidatus Electronema aureum]